MTTRPGRRRLDPIQRATAKRAARCPDCRSNVTIDDATNPPRVHIHHDAGCPALTSLQRQGRTTSIALLRGQDQSPAEFAATVADVAQAAVQQLGPVAVRLSPYAGVHGGPEEPPGRRRS